MHTNPERFSLQLPPDLTERLKTDAQAHERSLGAAIRCIVREHQAREKAFEPGFGHIRNEGNQP
jgi:plasmid stability protein